MNFPAFVRVMLAVLFIAGSPAKALFADGLLKTQDISKIMQQIFAQQGDHKEVSGKILKHAFLVYINQFDPDRLYLLEDDIKPYQDMSQSEIAAIIAEYKQDNFEAFQKLNTMIQRSIVRARTLRAQLEKDPARLFASAASGAVSWNEEGQTPSFAKDAEILKSRWQNSMISFIEAERRHFGDRVVMQHPAQSLRLYENHVREREDRYLYTDENGKALPAAQRENLFSMHVLKALASSLDAHTAFYSAAEAYNLRVHLENEFEGVGVSIEQTPNGSFIISALVPGSPAAKSGLVKAGDVLVAVDGRRVGDQPLEKVKELIRGKVGSEVALTLERQGELAEGAAPRSFTVKLKREEMVVNQDRAFARAVPYKNGIIGIITLDSFYQGNNGITSADDVRREIENLQKRGNLLGLILDLRENSGGFLNQAIKVVGLFITDGVVVIAKYFNGEERIYRDMDDDEAYKGPLVVLTSRATASAAEIVAQALQDYGVALVVGDPQTYGKGTIQSQTVTENNASSFFKVTVGQYYTVSGKSPQIQGVKADIVVPSPFVYEHLGEKYLGSTLPPGSIPPDYNDNLADVSPKEKEWFMHYYVPNLQHKESIWRNMLPTLRKENTYRLEHNKDYQEYLRRLKEGKGMDAAIFMSAKGPFPGDFQLNEAVNIVENMINLESKARSSF